MCNINQNSQLDEQRLLYIYQGLNVVMKLLNHHLDQQSFNPRSPFEGADSGKVIGMAWQAYKNGKISLEQYEEIFNIATGIKTVDVPSGQAHIEPFSAAKPPALGCRNAPAFGYLVGHMF